MISPKLTSPLLFAPSGQYVEGKVVSLTPEMADRHIHQGWWDESCLKAHFEPQPIDRYWNWNNIEIEHEGRFLKSEKVALVVGDDESVQGAMMLSVEPVASVLEPGAASL